MMIASGLLFFIAVTLGAPFKKIAAQCRNSGDLLLPRPFQVS
jgi:hypothetical protein